MARAVLDLDARSTVLDAARKLAAAPSEDDLALVIAAGAPLLRNAVFLDVLRAQAAPRRVSIVTPEARARAIASSVHLPAYASLAALERHELDPTERLEAARRTALGGPRPSAAPRRSSRRIAGIAGSLALALLVLAGVVLPEASVVVSPAAQPLGPFDLQVRAGAGGDIQLTPINSPVTAKIGGTATGSRTEETAARGSVQLENKTTDDVRVPKGSQFKTPDGIQFISTADATLQRSVIVPGTPFTLLVGKVTIAVIAVFPGPSGNVAARRITIGPDPNRYTVTNSEPTSGGESKKIPVVKLEDYDAAVKRAPDALKAAAEDQLARWLREPRAGQQVVPQVLVRQTQLTPANVDVVGKEAATFELTVAGIATAYAVPDNEPKHTAVGKLSEAAAAGNDVDERAAVIDVKSVAITDAPAVTWTVSARGSQSKHVDLGRVGRLLSGHAVRDAERILRDDGLRLVRLDWVPAWWPMLPLLDGRIHVTKETPPVTALP